MNRYSLTKMLLELEKLHVVEDASGNISKVEWTKRKKDFSDALEKALCW